MSFLLHKNSTLVSFNEVYTRYYKRAFLFVQSYVHDEQAAEDIASEALIKLWELRNDEKDYYVESFLFTILRNKALDYLRRQKMEARALSNLNDWRMQDFNIRLNALESCNPEKLFSKEIYQIMEENLAKLSPQTTRIFKLSRYENKSYKEIASIMGISVKSVEYHISKSLRLLRTALSDFLPFYLFFIYFNQ